MDNLVSVPVTNPCSFLKQQDKVVRPRQVQRDPLVNKTIKSAEPDPPVKPKRPAKPSAARKLAQEWLEF